MATPLRLGGIASGLDTETLIQKILDAERIPELQIKKRQSVLKVQKDAVSAIQKSLTTLKTSLAKLQDPAFFASSVANSSDNDIATATATTTAAKNTYTFVISSLASASTLRSGTSLGPAAQKISNPITSGSLLTDNTSYGSSLTLGTFTVNGATVTIDGTDTLTSTFTKISTATGGVVTGAYNAATDTITLTASSGNVVLGSGADTSDFLARSRLYSNGTATTTSLTSVGNIDTNQVISSAASRIATSGSLTTGTITVNGVSVSVDKDTDTLQDVLDRITASSAGVYAGYDSIEDRVVLTSKTTGSIGITVADGTSNFASSMKLTSTTSQLGVGNDTTFTVNGGVSRKSTDLVINDTESGVGGLTVSALTTGTVVITVATDNSTIQSEISNFITQFNSVQNTVESFSATPEKDAAPTDSASILANDSIITSLGSDLRRTATASPGTGTIRTLEDIGVTSTSTDNLLTFSDTSLLTSALANNPDEVISLFSDSTTGIMNTLETYLDTQLDTVTGAFPTRTQVITKEDTNLNDSIERIESQLSLHEEQLVRSFSLLEQFQSQANNILAFLKQRTNS